MKISTIFLFLLTIMTFMAQGQPPCEAHFNKEMLQQYDEFINYYYHQGGKAKKTAPVLKYLPITVHLVANDDGSQRISVEKVLRLFCDLNETFQQANFYFLLDEIKFHENTNWNTNESGVRSSMPNQTKVENTINVYFLGNTPTSDICGVYYGNAVNGGEGGSPDIIVISRGCATDATFAHEIGHFLSLPHTFSGWEESGTEGNEGAAPSWAEQVDGDNCTTAGDKLCDTAPDYLYTRWSTASCETSGTYTFELEGTDVRIDLVDSDSTAFTVDGRNIMSYASNTCRDSFTQDQTAAMHFHLDNYRTAYLQNGASLTTIQDEVNLTYPQVEDETPFDRVTFEWDAVPGATHYLVQVNYTLTFLTSLAIDEIIVTNTSATFYNLPVGRKLYWRVIPYHPSYTCHSGTFTSFRTGVFSSGESDTELENIQLFSLNPNPFTLARSLSAYILVSEATNADILIYSASGQLIDQQSVELTLGQNFVRLPRDRWLNGIYLVMLRTPNGQLTRKLVYLE